MFKINGELVTVACSQLPVKVIFCNISFDWLQQDLVLTGLILLQAIMLQLSLIVKIPFFWE